MNRCLPLGIRSLRTKSQCTARRASMSKKAPASLPPDDEEEDNTRWITGGKEAGGAKGPIDELIKWPTLSAHPIKCNM